MVLPIGEIGDVIFATSSAKSSPVSGFRRAYGKAPEGWRSPKRFANFWPQHNALASWTAVALYRSCPGRARYARFGGDDFQPRKPSVLANFRLSLSGRKCALHLPMLACLPCRSFSEGWSANLFPDGRRPFQRRRGSSSWRHRGGDNNTSRIPGCLVSKSQQSASS